MALLDRARDLTRAGPLAIFTEPPPDEPEVEEEELQMTLVEHLDELRGRLIKSVGALAVMTAIAFLFTPYLFQLLIVPAPDVPANAVRKRPLPMRGVTTKGHGSEIKYALAHAGEILATLERSVGIEYPYDKLDLIAVPDKGGAMENPGAVTFANVLPPSRER